MFVFEEQIIEERSEQELDINQKEKEKKKAELNNDPIELLAFHTRW